MGLSLSLSGMPNTGHDIGGFYGAAPDFELLIRWVQCGIFFPRFAIHSWNTDGTVNEPWMYPEALPYIREAIRLRCRLIPYLYTLLDAMHRTGAPIMRPLVYHFPDDSRSRAESFSFLLGADLLIAPVYVPGARTWHAYLPPGAWFDFHTGAQFNGGREVAADAPLDRIPVFARANALIPMGRVMRHVGELPDDQRTILAFPTTGRADGLIVEDDGVSLAYQRGEQTRVTLTMESDDRTIRLAASARGGFALPYATVTFALPPGEQRSVEGGESESVDANQRRQIIVRVQHGG
jgi:alpha-glucosidase